jgi:hypothetical protein
MNPFDHCLDMAARCATYAQCTADARYRLFLVEMATTWCDLAHEFLDGAARGLERIGEIAKMVAELESFDPQALPRAEGFEPRMIPRVLH